MVRRRELGSLSRRNRKAAESGWVSITPGWSGRYKGRKRFGFRFFLVVLFLWLVQVGREEEEKTEKEDELLPKRVIFVILVFFLLIVFLLAVGRLFGIFEIVLVSLRDGNRQTSHPSGGFCTGQEEELVIFFLRFVLFVEFFRWRRRDGEWGGHGILWDWLSRFHGRRASSSPLQEDSTEAPFTISVEQEKTIVFQDGQSSTSPSNSVENSGRRSKSEEQDIFIRYPELFSGP
jgi:hypothetical protein